MNYGQTKVVLCEDARQLGDRAAQDVATALADVLKTKPRACVILAAGESQNTFLPALAKRKEIDWSRVVGFAQDEFWDPKMDRRFTCEYQIRSQLTDQVHPHAVHFLDCNAADPEAEARRFEKLLRDTGPIDVVCAGVGTSGHIAMNEPGVSPFDEPRWTKVVELVEQSKKQLRADPNFKALGYIPEKGITLTLPAMMSGKRIISMVPLALKRDIITRLFACQRADESFPASILFKTPSMLYLDRDSCPAHLISTKS